MSTVPTIRRHRTGFWVVAVVFLMIMAYATVPTPLYPLYQEADDYAPSTTTVVLAFAVGVMVSLYLAGHVSDWTGRRKILMISALVAAASAALFLASPALPMLLAARLVNGLAVGILTATATAHLAELRAIARPDESTFVAASIAGAANIGGLALGPLIGGLFAEFLPAPLELPHLVFLVLLIVAVIALLIVPETAPIPDVRPAWRPQRVSPPKGSERRFWVAAAAGFSAFSVFGLFTSLAPAYLVSVFGITDHLLAGTVTFAVFGSAAACQVIFARLSLPAQLLIAVGASAAGLVAVAVGAVGGVFGIFLAGAIVAGGGVGILFRAGLQAAIAIAPPAQRGGAIALYFLIGYTGLAVPVLIVGIALLSLPADGVLIVFLAVAVVATAWSGLRMRHDTLAPVAALQ